MTAPATSSPASVAVIGGGISGLSAAIHAAERGLPVTVFERTDLLVGKAKGWEICLPGATDGPQTVEHGIHGWWNNYLNFKAFLNRLPGGAVLSTGTPGMIDISDILVVKPERFRDAAPGLRELENCLVIGEADMSGLWGPYSTASLNPLLFPWAERTLRGADFLFGMDTFRQLAEVSVLLRDEDAFVARARQDVGFRAFAAAISVPPPEWLDAWTLQELLAALPFHDTVRQWITLFQSGATYWSTSDTSAWHVARLFDFYALRNAAAMWWEMPRRGAYHDVFARMEAYATSLGVEIRRCAPVHRVVPRGETVDVSWGYEGQQERFAYAVAALDIPNARKVLRHPDAWPDTASARDFFKRSSGRESTR